MLRRLGALAGAVAATLAFAASAHAAPSAPVITKPAGSIACGSPITLAWKASTPDPGGLIVQYRVDMGDLTAGTAGWKWVNGLSTNMGTINAHHYVMRVRALQLKNGALTWSATSYRTFYAACLAIPAEKLSRYVAYNPFPECIMCGGLKALEIEDPVIYRAVSGATLPAADQIRGLQLEADGSVFEI
jgi:hypothetical protein